MAALRFRRLAPMLVALLGAGALVACEPPPPPPRFVVNAAGDLADPVPGDGHCGRWLGCSLRAAVEEAEAVEGPAEIGFAPGMVISAPHDSSPLPTVTQDLVIDGTGARLGDHQYELVHHGGILGLVDFDLAEVDSCGASGPGKGLVLARYHLQFWHGLAGSVCTNSATIVVESEIQDLTVVGAVPIHVQDAKLATVRGAHAHGRIVASTIDLVRSLGTGVLVSGSKVGTCGFTSAGRNLVPATCAAAIETDIVDPDPSATIFESPAVDAIPAGTPELCSGDRRDHRGVVRPFGGACDIGGLESTVPFLFGVRQRSNWYGAVHALDVNDAGVAVGMLDGTGAVRFDLTSGAIEPLGIDGTPAAVNATGSVAGWAPSATEATDAFRWDRNGTTTWLSGIGGDGEEALDLDDQGRAVGWATTSGGVRQAVLWEVDGTASVLSSDGQEARATAVNDTGTVVGVVGTGTAQHAVRWDVATGVRTDLSGDRGTAYDVNDAGVVAGSIRTSWGEAPVVWDPGETSPVDLPAVGVLGDGSVPRAHATRILDDGSVLVTRVGAIEAAFLIQAAVLVPADRSEVVDLDMWVNHSYLTHQPAGFVAISPGGRHLVWADRCLGCDESVLEHISLVPRG